MHTENKLQITRSNASEVIVDLLVHELEIVIN